MNGSLCAKLEGSADAKMEHSPAKYQLVMVLVVDGGVWWEDWCATQGSPTSLSSQESDKSKLKES